MSEDKNSNHLGEISTIRNILMGEQMSVYEDRFQQLTQLLKETENRIMGALKALEEKQDQNLTATKDQWNTQFAHLEQILKEQVKQLNQRVDEVSTEDKKRLGTLLSDLGKQLMQ